MANPWGEGKPTLNAFVEHYKSTMSKDKIIERVNVAFELGLDIDMTKAELLTAVFDRDDTCWSNMEESNDPDIELEPELELEPEPEPEPEPELSEDDTPSETEMAEVGLIANESVGARPEPEDEGAFVPSTEQVTDEGYSAEAAEKIVAAFQAAADVVKAEKTKRDAVRDPSGRPHYVVSSPLKRGYCAVGRRFTVEDIVFADELDDVGRRELDLASPKHLTVERIGFGNDEV